MKFDVEAARKSGYSDKEIEAASKFDFEGAKKAGYSDQEIQDAIFKHSEGKNIGEQGKIVGGIVGGALQGIAENPSGLLKSLPTAGLQLVENTGKAFSGGVRNPLDVFNEYVSGEAPPKQASELLQDYLTQGYTPEEKRNAQHLTNVEEFLLSLVGLLGGGPKKVKPGKTTVETPPFNEPNIPPSAPPEPPIPPPSRSVPPKPTSTDLAEAIVPGKRVSPFEIAEIALAETKPVGFEPKTLGKEVKVPEPLVNASDVKSLEGRATTAQKRAANEISTDSFKSDREAGVLLKNAANDIKKSLQTTFNKEFAELKEATQAISGPQPDLVKQIKKFIEENEGTLLKKEGAGAEKKVLAAAKELYSELQYTTPFGEFVGYKDISLAELFKTKKTLGDVADFEIADSTFKGAYKHLYGEVDKAIEHTLKAKAPNEYARFQRANKRYSGFKDTFSNDNVIELFEPKNINYESIFKGLLTPDKIRAAEAVFSHSEQGQKVLNKLKRDYFLQETSKDSFTAKDAANLKEVLGDKFKHAVDHFQAPRETFKVKISPQKTKAVEDKLKKIADRVAQHSQKTPEQILSKLDSRSGIRELRKEFGYEVTDALTNEKVRSILREGEIEHKFTGEQLKKAINKEHNFEIFSEKFGQEATEEMLQLATQFAERELTTEGWLNVAKSLGIAGARLAGFGKFIKIVNALTKAPV